MLAEHTREMLPPAVLVMEPEGEMVTAPISTDHKWGKRIRNTYSEQNSLTYVHIKGMIDIGISCIG